MANNAQLIFWSHLPMPDNIQVTYKEIDEMIHTVDKNGDGKISYSEFRVMMGAPPLLHTLSGHYWWWCELNYNSKEAVFRHKEDKKEDGEVKIQPWIEFAQQGLLTQHFNERRHWKQNWWALSFCRNCTFSKIRLWLGGNRTFVKHAKSHQLRPFKNARF